MDHNQKEPAHDIFVVIAMSSNESSDESAHLHILTRAIAARVPKVWT